MSGKYPTVVKGECVMATYDSVNDKRKKKLGCKCTQI